MEFSFHSINSIELNLDLVSACLSCNFLSIDFLVEIPSAIGDCGLVIENRWKNNFLCINHGTQIFKIDSAQL